MDSDAVLYLSPLVAGTIVSLLLAWMIYPRRSSPMIRTFIFLLLAAAFWTFAYAMELWSGSYSASFFWRKVKYFGIVFIPVLWVVFAFQYGGKDHWVNQRNLIVLSIIPIFTLILLWTNEYHSLYYSETSVAEWGPFTGIDDIEGPAYWVFTSYTYILLMVGNLLILKGAVSSSSIFARQSLAAVCGITIPLIGNILYIIGINPFPFRYDMTPSLFVLSGLVIWGGIVRYRFLDIVPIARETLVENFNDAIFVLDEHNRIIDINPAAREMIYGQLIPYPSTDVIGEQAMDVFSQLPQLISKCQEMKKIRSEIELSDEKKTRCFEIEISPVSRYEEEISGRVLVLKDITERKQTEKLIRTQLDLEHALDAASGLEEALQIYLDASIRISGMDAGGVYLVEEMFGTLDLVHHRGLPPSFVESASHYDADSPNTQLIMAGKPIYRQYQQLDLPKTASFKQDYLQAIAIIPVVSGGKVIACINVASHTLDEIPEFARIALETISHQMGGRILRIRAEEALRRSEERFRQVAENAEEWIWEVDASAMYTYASPIVEKLLGYKPEEIVGKKYPFDLFHPVDRENLKKEVLELFRERKPIFRFLNRNVHKDGRVVWLLTSGVPIIDEEGRFVGYRGADIDITERKQVEEKRDELENMKSKFILMASHEIGTPVMAMEHRIDSIEAGLKITTAEENEDISSLRRNLKRLKNLKTFMYNLVILELGKFTLNKIPLFLQTIAQNVMNELHFLAKKKEIDLKIDILELPVIMADENKIHEVLSILLDNAIRFTPKGGRVQVAGKEDGDFIEVLVKDNGIGIPKNEQRKIFDRFYQVKNILQHKEGFGLGLSLAKGIIQSHGGDIRVESEPGKGSVFSFRIPKNDGKRD